MKSLLCLLAAVIACCLAPSDAVAQPSIEFELSCPAGYSPVSNMGRTYNAPTRKWRANFCVSTSGDGRMLCQADGCQTFPFSATDCGTAALPPYGFVPGGLGMFCTATPSLDFSVNSNRVLHITRPGSVTVVQIPHDSGGFCFGATLDAPDSCFWRLGSSQVGFGNGTLGDFSGTFRMGAIIGGNTGDLTGFNQAFFNTFVNSPKYQTASNCSNAAAPAVCGSAAAGRVVIAAAATTVTVNTTAVTANSEIRVQFDESITGLGTCNTAAGSEAATYFVSAKVAGTSFTIKTSAAPVTNPACVNFHIVN